MTSLSVHGHHCTSVNELGLVHHITEAHGWSNSGVHTSGQKLQVTIVLTCCQFT